MIQLDSFERANVSPETLAVLCKFAMGDLQQAIPNFPTDWQPVLEGVTRNGLLGITFYYLQNSPHAPHIPQDFKDAVMKLHRVNTAKMGLRYLHTLQVLKQLNDSKLDYLVMKGPAVAYSLYPDPSVRVFNDLDIIVRERDWNQTHNLMTGWGYELMDEGFEDLPPKLGHNAAHYEIKYVHKQTKLRVEVHGNDILNAGLVSRDLEGIWQRAQTLMIKNVPVKVFSYEDHLMYLCAHIHYHGYTRLNWFTDIVLLVRDHADKINWDHFIGIVCTEDAKVPVYYTLYFLGKLLDIHAPAYVLQALQPDKLRQRLHEWYMPEADVLSFRPMPRADLSFYFLPLFKRMLPDLLIMGRRREKLVYLAHVFVPSRAWLRYYYQLDSHARVEIHYLLHPIKLTFHYLREIFNAVVNPQANWAD